MLMYDNVQKVNIWDVLHHPWTKYQSINGFALGAFK
jgi:hypothetical protein